MFGRRLEDLRNGFSVPPGTKFPNLSSQTSSESGGLGGGIPDLSFGMYLSVPGSMSYYGRVLIMNH